MNLADVKWEPAPNSSWKIGHIVGQWYVAYVIDDYFRTNEYADHGLYAIGRHDDGNNMPYRHLDPIAAQAIIYQILKDGPDHVPPSHRHKGSE